MLCESDVTIKVGASSRFEPPRCTRNASGLIGLLQGPSHFIHRAFHLTVTEYKVSPSRTHLRSDRDHRKGEK
jgi:hypothetical protein